mgnify:FL=1|jgi:hypothetical protein
MKKISRQQDVTVANVLRCLNELNDENMVYVGTEPPEEVKKGLIWVNPEEITEEPEKIYVGHMVGDIYPVSYTELESGQLVLKGQLVSREIYGILWAWLQKHPSLLITEQEYTEYVNSSENLCCPYFSTGTTENNFRLPNYNGVFFKATNDTSKINEYETDKQRNISGQFTSHQNGSLLTATNVNGAFSWSTSSISNLGEIGDGYGKNYPIYFDASRSVGTEHTGSEVKPKSLNQVWVVQAFGVITNASSLDISVLEQQIQQITDYSNYEVSCIKNNPVYYNRDQLFYSNKTNITIPKNLKINIDGECYISTINKVLQLSTVDTPQNLSGKDVYIYACKPQDISSTEPIFVLSLNSTVPTGYTASSSRKIGGFHCLCADVGTIDGHTLSGYVTGDILPASIWDLLHRPKGDSEGLAYDEVSECWLSIYHLSWDGTKLVSVYNGVIADGASTKKWHGEAFIEQLMNQKMRLPWRHEFQMAAKGSNEGTSIKNAADPNTTGGHVDSNNRRMISNIGLEDCCGCSWQWAMDLGFAGGSEWNDSVYNSNVDSQRYGQSYGTLYRLLLGASWKHGSNCGSRSVNCNAGSSRVFSDCSARGASEPRVVTNLN